MATGKVKWFNNAKGYGFVLPDGGGDDLFVHYSSIQMEGYKTLKAGQAVTFDVLEGPKGFHATNIQCDSADAAEGDGNTTQVLSVTVEDDAALQNGSDESHGPAQLRGHS